MPLSLKTIYTSLEKSKFGVHINAGIYNNFLDKSASYLKIERVIRFSEEKNSISIVLNIKNTSKQSIQLNSMVLTDFKIQSVVDRVLNNGWLSSSLSTYVKPKQISKKKSIVLKRDTNPTSFDQGYGFLKNSVVSEWFTKIKFKKKTLLVGFSTTDKYYSQVFVRTKEKNSVQIRATCQLDNISLAPREQITSNTLEIILDNDSNSETIFANKIKQNMQVDKISKPLRGLLMAFYYNGNYIDKKMFDQQVEHLKKLKLQDSFNCICIDAGYCKYWGDWLYNKERFDSGMKYVADKINSMGYIPCIWVAPLVADPRSKMYKKNKGWFFEDTQVNMNVRFSSPIERIMPNMGLKLVDPTSEDYINYITNVANTFSSYGFKMFKLDFLYPLAFFNNFSTETTRAAALRNILKIFKNANKKNNLLLTALTQLSPLVGLVDYVRVGGDSASPYVRNIPILGDKTNNSVLEHSLKAAKTREFLNKKAWLNDYDCIIFSSKNPEKNRELNEQIENVFNSGACLWFGDNLAKLNKTQTQYLKEILTIHKNTF